MPARAGRVGGAGAPGQERVLAPYRDRYFTEALPALSGCEVTMAGRLARLLYPATFADAATIAATGAALGLGGLDEPLRMVLLEQGAVLQQILAARSRNARGPLTPRS